MVKKQPELTGDRDGISEGSKNYDIEKLIADFSSNFGNVLSTNSNLGLKYPTMDVIMNQYMDRADNNDPTCVRVSMNDAKRIEFADSAETDEVIFTFGLGGCIATALILEMKDGTQKAILAHYSPLDALRGASNFSYLAKDINPDTIKQAKVLILAPGEYEKNSEGKWDIKIDESAEQYVDLLAITAQRMGGENTQVEKIGYLTAQLSGEQNPGTFRIVKGKDKRIQFIVGDYSRKGQVFP